MGPFRILVADHPICRARPNSSPAGSVRGKAPATGAALGTFTVGTSPQLATFDGANIWVPNFRDGTVTKLRASDGTALGTFSVGQFPAGIAFDGDSIWVILDGPGDGVVKLRASDGTSLGGFPTGAYPAGIAFDGAFIWVANSGSGTVSKM